MLARELCGWLSLADIPGGIPDEDDAAEGAHLLCFLRSCCVSAKNVKMGTRHAQIDGG